MQSHDRTAPETTRDMILQLVAYIKQMNYQANQANTNWSELLGVLEKANKLCVPIVNALRDK